MLSEWELWACAHKFVKDHDADAPILAAMRADALREAGDENGARTFQAIVQRINQLLETPTGPLH
jgi:hypothetical protein